MDHLFDVTLSNYGNSETGEFAFRVEVVDTYNQGVGGRRVLGAQEFTGTNALDEAVEWTKGAVTAFMRGTQA